ncbi:sigma factor-like helix-turn-helix DNA-binding protein [Streptomyces flaveus]|uniref:sigma factor-like helix-turn-helix DNA-binding protein n=1 Tax=Streptomyces flaveus TaxID=66370 RepID=UPI00331A9E72
MQDAVPLGESLAGSPAGVEELGVPVGTVDSRLSRARKKLRSSPRPNRPRRQLPTAGGSRFDLDGTC